jgi:TM2 domain-containing membrane protein YozV
MPPEKMKTSDEKYCLECGEIIKRRAEICPYCGVRQINASSIGLSTVSAPNGKNKLAAGLFAILLGSLGAHRFYLNDTGMAILYLLFCWTGIPAIIGIIEGIMFLTLSDDEFILKYGQR